MLDSGKRLHFARSNQCRERQLRSDTINFNIPVVRVKTIHLASNLPFINSPVTIDGYTRRGC